MIGCWWCDDEDDDDGDDCEEENDYVVMINMVHSLIWKHSWGPTF